MSEADQGEREVGGVPVLVLEQFDRVRLTGQTNMMDRIRVQYVAYTLDCSRLVDLIEDYGQNGYPFLLQAFRLWKEGQGGE